MDVRWCQSVLREADEHIFGLGRWRDELAEYLLETRIRWNDAAAQSGFRRYLAPFEQAVGRECSALAEQHRHLLAAVERMEHGLEIERRALELSTQCEDAVENARRECADAERFIDAAREQRSHIDGELRAVEGLLASL